MIKKTLLASTFALALVACDNQNQNVEKTEATKTETVAATTITPVSLADFPAKAEGLFKKEVEIKGIVDHVCAHGGRKMVLVQEGTDNRVIIFAGDDMPNFSTEWEGSEVKVDGLVVDKDYLMAMNADTKDHHAKDGNGPHGEGDGHNHEGHDHDHDGHAHADADGHNHDHEGHAHTDADGHNHEGHDHAEGDSTCSSEQAAKASQQNNDRMFFILANTAEEVPAAE